MISAFPTLIQALPITLFMAIAAMVFAIIGGLILALITKNKIPVLHQLSKLYISFFRGVPTLVQLFLIYYGLPQLFPEMSKMTALTAAIIGLSLKTPLIWQKFSVPPSILLMTGSLSVPVCRHDKTSGIQTDYSAASDPKCDSGNGQYIYRTTQRNFTGLYIRGHGDVRPREDVRIRKPQIF